YGGRKLQKAGDEYYLLMPNYNQSNLTAGIYYLAVASEGVNPNGGRIGTGGAAYTLSSTTPLVVTDLGTVDGSGATDLIHSDSNEGGEIKAFSFTVPPDTLNLEVYLENTTGNLLMVGRPDNRLCYFP